MAGLHKDIETLKGKLSSVEQERDQLRMANSQFNTQYQDQAKEVKHVYFLCINVMCCDEISVFFFFFFLSQ